MNKTFYNLPEEKKQAIIEACLDEFIQHGYENASTNNIVRIAGISKGSLFQYFSSKEDLYFFILGDVAKKINAFVKERIKSITGDFVDRLMMVTRLGMDYYIQDQKSYRMYQQLDMQVHATRLSGYLTDVMQDSVQIYQKLLFGAETSKLRYSVQECMELLSTCIIGFKVQFFTPERYKLPPEKLREEFMAGLEKISRFMKTALFIEPEEVPVQSEWKEMKMVNIDAGLDVLYCLMTVDNEIHEKELKEIFRFLLKAGFEIEDNHLRTRDADYESLILKMGTLSSLSREALENRFVQSSDFLQKNLNQAQKEKFMDYALDMVAADGKILPEEKNLLDILAEKWEISLEAKLKKMIESD